MKFHGKTLPECTVYQMINRNEVITKTIHEVVTKGEILSATGDDADLSDFLYNVSRKFRYGEKYTIVDMIKSGRIKVVLSPVTAAMPAMMPFVLDIVNGQLIAYVFANNFLNGERKKGDYRFYDNKLFAVCSSAYTAMKYVTSPAYVKRSAISTVGTRIYGAMFTRVLNKEYALNTNKDRQQKVQFLAGLFFVVNVLQYPFDDHSANLAINATRDPNRIILNDLLKHVDASVFENLDSFIKFLASDETGLKLSGLNLRGYMEAFTMMYDSSAVLALEAFPYFTFNIIAVAQATYLNKQYAFEDFAAVDAQKFYRAVIEE